MKEQIEYTCRNCGDTFVRDAGKAFKFCSRKCAAENKARLKRFEKERLKRLKEFQQENAHKTQNLSEMARSGREMNGCYGNYGNMQVQETLAMIQTDRKERIEQIRKGWKK